MNEPTDHELCSLVFSIWRHGGSQELRNLSLCMASRQRETWTPEYETMIHRKLKALVKSGNIRRVRLLPGRPAYTIA